MPDADQLPNEAEHLRRQLYAAVDSFVDFVGAQDLTTRTSDLEMRLLGKSMEDVREVIAAAGLTDDVLTSALTVRTHLGRVSDLVHAATIGLALPHILDPGERITVRPSLGPGNDKLRPYDLETNLRIAEFKISIWQGKDSGRQRGLVKDIVGLALDERPLRKCMYVVGDRPIRYLQSSATTVTQRLNRNAPASLQQRWDEVRGHADPSVADYMTTCGVEVIDLTPLVVGLTGHAAPTG